MTADDYQRFLGSKALAAPLRGIDNIPPLASHLFPHQAHCVEFGLRVGSWGCFLDTGLGKAMASTTRVVTPTGYRAMSELRIGDLVIGGNGTPTEVLGVYPQGARQGLRVSFSDQSSVVCDREHLWMARTSSDLTRGRAWRILTLGEMMDIGIGRERNGVGTGRWFIPQVSPVEFEERCDALPLHPYVLGCLIGDGGIGGGSPILSSGDTELIDRVRSLLPTGVSIEKKRYSRYDYQIAGIRRHGSHEENRVTDALRELGLMGKKSPEKFIPDCYKFAAVDTRLALLQGLLDTDGGIWITHGCPVIEFSSSSKRLADDVLFLIQSLGGKGHVKEKATKRLPSFRIIPAFPNNIKPFLLSRKAALCRDRTKYMPARSIRAVTDAGQVDMTCIKVAAADGLFVVEDFIVTHNTACELEYLHHAAQQSNGKALLLTPLAVARQIATEGKRWGYDVRVIREPDDVRSGINICNYDRLDRLSPDDFGAVALDESGILKSFTGKTTRALIDRFASFRWRMAATATPAPNDHVELAQHAEFIGLMARDEMLVRWFINDGSDTKSWRLKRHAVTSFFDWMSSWSRMAEHPRNMGFEVAGFDLPPLQIHKHRADAVVVPEEGSLFAQAHMSATTMHDVKRQTASARAELAAALVTSDSNPWVMWCDTDYEADALLALLGDRADVVEVRGSHSIDVKESRIASFLDGTKRVMITKSSICGFGLNLQFCSRTVFVGRSFSYEAWYQAVRRFWRFGQPNPVNVHIIVADGEDSIGRVIDRKGDDHARMKAAMISAMRRAVGRDATIRNPYNPTHEGHLPSWLLSEVYN